MEQTQQNHFTALFYKNVLLGILSMAAQSIFILADTFFIANGIGTEALAGLRCFRPRLRKKKSKKPISILV